jgi:hypothetical protein
VIAVSGCRVKAAELVDVGDAGLANESGQAGKIFAGSDVADI